MNLFHRAKRIAEMKAAAALAKFGTVLEITAPEYVQEVNNAGDGVNVVLHLYKQGLVHFLGNIFFALFEFLLALAEIFGIFS